MFYILMGLIIVVMILLYKRYKRMKLAYPPSSVKFPKFQLWMIPVLIVVACVAYIVIGEAIGLVSK